ncbi:sortase [Actinokineospora auranticolor]|uniref:LPXTG-site transpeptidase (Sortase) family protein n=1 Tax=Actinokineospora auranticolor TaxID=155976 RepID=A0A2S6GI48_9PSEU|nr:sortase [Actinokineospora auranticolor]PPK64863.1 LPXTG-site transpeptidase (sortase) family protein [Actinokineospora auranticolor]
MTMVRTRPTEVLTGRRSLPVALVAVATLAGLALGFVAFAFLLTPLQANHEQDRLYDQLREQLGEATAAPFSADGPLRVIEPGTPVAVLEIPALGLRKVVVEGTTSGDLTAGVGHRRDTALPGQYGVSLVYGRRAAYGGPFGEVVNLVPGNEIHVVTGQGTFTYLVDGTRRDGDPVPAPLTDGGARLTLVTASGRPFMPESTVYVDATLAEGDAQPAPVRRPQLVPPDEKAMRSDRAAVPLLALWIPALGLAVAATVWLRHRFGRAEGLLIGVPICLAVLWNVYDTGLRLLPNLL